MDSFVGETIIIEWQSENTSSISKRDKGFTLIPVMIHAICALLNSNGGKVVLRNDNKDNLAERLPFSQMSITSIRKLEQSMISIIGTHQTASNINLKEDNESMVISVKKSDVLITTTYNLYLATETQVVLISSLESLEIIKDDIIKRKVVLQAVQLGSHCKIFLKGKICGFLECKSVEFQCLRSDRARRTRLADRMTGKGNKFSCYVSAFANYQGGHIYYGIRDDGIVEGELISSEEDKNEITKKVEKAINKMIWPELIGQPKRGVYWDIFFEPVVDENNSAIPSPFVIVVFIAPCLGGVFTEVPECYETVGGKVQKMSFVTWKRRILQPVWLRSKDEIPSSVRRITWSSAGARKAFTFADQVLMQVINNGSWYAITHECKYLEKRYQNHLCEMKLLALSKQVTACYRRGNFNEAQDLLEHYTKMLPQAEDILIFEVINLYLSAALERARGDFQALKELLVASLSKAYLIEPGIVTAIVYIFAATVADLVDSEIPTPDVLSIKALEHLSRVPDSSDILADMKQKSYITLATFYLRCNISGQCTKGNDNVDIPSLNRAKTCITAVHESTCEGNPLSGYREVQLNLVQSIYHFRYSQSMRDIPDERTRFLRNAFNYAKKAGCLAKYYQFTEMFQWSKANQALCTEELLRVPLKSTLCTTKGAIHPAHKSNAPLESKSQTAAISDVTRKSIAPLESKSRIVEISHSTSKSHAPLKSTLCTAKGVIQPAGKSNSPLESKSKTGAISDVTRKSIAPLESKSRIVEISHSTSKSHAPLKSTLCTAKGVIQPAGKSNAPLESKSQTVAISHATSKSFAPLESKSPAAEISHSSRKAFAPPESKLRTAKKSRHSTRKSITPLGTKLPATRKSCAPLGLISCSAEKSELTEKSIALLEESTSSLPESAPCLDI